jgi:hypothetical protein
MYVMEWSILILTRIHLLYHWKFFVAILVQMDEVCVIALVIFALSFQFVFTHAVKILVLNPTMRLALCIILLGNLYRVQSVALK